MRKKTLSSYVENSETNIVISYLMSTIRFPMGRVDMAVGVAVYIATALRVAVACGGVQRREGARLLRPRRGYVVRRRGLLLLSWRLVVQLRRHELGFDRLLLLLPGC